MLAYIDIVTNSAPNSFHFQQIAYSYSIDFECCLFLPCCGNVDLGQKRTASLIRAHNGSLYCGSKPQRTLIITQITAVFGPNQQHTIQLSLGFP